MSAAVDHRDRAPMTREEAVAAVAEATAERDNIRANLLDLDASFGKRMLEGATLTGQTRERWAAEQAELARLWETFTTYSAVLDRTAEIVARLGRSPGGRLAEITGLLRGPSVRLPRAQAPLQARELTADATAELTVSDAVAQMRRGYAGVAAVCDAAQGVWDGIAPGLQEAATRLAEAATHSAGLGDQALANAVGAAQANLDGLRDTLNGDPLTFWAGGRVDTARLTRLTGQVTGVAARAAELDRLRQQAGSRISALTAAISAADTARQDAAVAWQRAAAKIADAVPPPMPDVTALAGRLAALTELRAGGRWGRLAAELDAAENDAAAATSDCRAAERAARAQLDRRNELRGLLDAYRAKAARLGAAEDAGLEELYGRARGLLWTAPCDVGAAAAAVSGYQQAVLAIGGQGGPA